jgi:phage repressor protein C with HTH and peptisase S24 domain
MGHEIIKQLRKERGWTLLDLATRMNSYPQQISKYELGQTELTLPWMQKFADVFDVSLSVITGESAAKTQRFTDNATRKTAASEHDYAPPQSHDYELPVYGSAAAAEGRIDAIGAETGTLDLRSLRNSFAAVVSGNSMEPRYRHGDYALVARDEWPQPHQDCLIETTEDEGYIKIYIGHNDKKLTCEQLNPRQKWEMPMTRVKSVQLVKGRWK